MPGNPSNGAATPQFPRLVRDEPKNQRIPAANLETRGMIAWLALMSAVSCLGGGFELMLWPRGNRYLPPLEVLAHTPFESYFVPGLLLTCVGGASLACAIAVLRRAPAATELTLLAGGTLSVWMIVEIAILRTFDAMTVVYTVFGLLLLALGIRSAWRTRLARYRWWIIVTLAEACGFVAPAAMGVLTAKADIEGVPQASLLVASGVIEGLLLGTGQAYAFPLPLRKARYVAYTGLSAGFAWASAMTVVALASAPQVPTLVSIIAGAVAAVLSLWAMGAGQWLELRRHTQHAKRWITWTALAWLLALPFSFAPGPFVDESTELSSQIALWGTGGALMACIMALITWQGVCRISRTRPASERETERSNS